MSETASPPPRRSASMRAVALAGLKWGLFIVVLVFVGRYGHRQWSQLDLRDISWSGEYLVAAAVVYFLGWVPAAWVWGEMLRSAGHSLAFYQVVRAHFCGHIGKYIPGKALTLVIRAALVREYRVPLGMAGIMATAETLLTMATGIIMFVVFLPLLLKGAETSRFAADLPILQPVLRLSDLQLWGMAGAILVASLCSLPVLVFLLKLVTRKLSEKQGEMPARELKLSVKQLLLWMGVLTFGWFLNGCSLGLVLMGIGIPVSNPFDTLLWMGAVTGATSLGFFVLFAPGGLGVREALMIAVLQLSPQIEPGYAVVAAVLMRFVSLVSELLFAVLLYSYSGKHLGKHRCR